MIDPLSMNRNLKYYPIETVSECRIHGRNKIINGTLPLFCNRSGVEIATSGTELWVDIKAGCKIFEPWIALEINGAFIMRQMVLPGEYPVCLFRGMKYGDIKRAFIYRELQAMNDDDECHILVKGLYSDGKFERLPARKHKLEFVGDSITSGEGTYGAYYDMDWLPMYMSYSRTYAGILEKEFDAQVRVVSQGGWGVYSGWDNNFSHNIPSVYGKVCGLAGGELNRSLGAQDDYVPGDWQPDAVIINLGTNDEGAFDQPPFLDPVSGVYTKLKKDPDGSLNNEDTEKIEKAVEAFLGQVRGLYPKTFILWIYGMIGNRLSKNLERAVLGYGKKNRDHNVSYLLLPAAKAGEMGSRDHPGYAAHKKTADILIDHLKKKISV